MAGRQDIQAGRAYVELFLKNNAFVKGLDAAGQRLESFGLAVAKVGAGVTASGTALLAPLTASLYKFASFGGMLDDVAQRSGITASKIGLLKYAAERSASTIEEVEAGLAKLNLQLFAASRGSQQSAEALRLLGFSFKELQGLKPEEQLQAIADRLAMISDTGTRAAVAQSLFGKQGRMLVPLLLNLRQLMAEGEGLGLGMSEQDIANAAKVSAAMKNLKEAGNALAYAIGAPLAEDFLRLEKSAIKIIASIREWVTENAALVETVAAVGFGVVVAGKAIVSFGIGLFFVGKALTSTVALLGAAKVGITFLLTPLGLVTGVLAVGAVAWLRYSDAGQKAIAGLGQALTRLSEHFRWTFDGIKNAILGGDLELAGGIAMSGLKVSLLTGVQSIAAEVGGAWGDFIGKTAMQLGNGDLEGAWGTVVEKLSAVWAEYLEGVVALTNEALTAVVNAWEAATKKIAALLVKWGESGSPFFQALIQGGLGETAGDRSQRLNQQRAGQLQGRRQDILADLDRARAEGGAFTDDAGNRVTMKWLYDELSKIDADLVAIAQGEDSVGMQVADAQANIAGQADALRARIAEANRAAQQRTQEALAAAQQSRAGGSAELDDALAKARAELDRLRNEAQRVADQARNEQQLQADEAAAMGLGGGPASYVAGTFSAAAARGIGGPGQQIVRELAKTREERRAQFEAEKADRRNAAMARREMLRALNEGGVFGA